MEKNEIQLHDYLSFGAIQVRKDGMEWDIVTPSSVYRINIESDGVVNAVCYGSQTMLEDIILATSPEIPVRGGFPIALPLLEVIFSDGVRDVELTFKSYEIIAIEGHATLKIVQQDRFYPLELTSFIRVLPEYDMIEKWVEVRNTGKEEKDCFKIENLQSGSVFLPFDSYELTHFSGGINNELRPNTVKLTQGTKTLQVRSFKSYGSSSFIVRPEGETCGYSGKTWFGSIVYSGNWRIDFEKMYGNFGSAANLQIIGGMNFWDQELNLKPGQSYTTPRIVFGYAEEGTEGVTLRLTSFIREQLLPENLRDKNRPVLYNGYQHTGNAVHEQHQLALAKIAKEVGVEMFVIDAGWWEGSPDTGSYSIGMGDWMVNRDKFPSGLHALIDNINAMGMEFGLWFEPETVAASSENNKNHPEWIFHYPTRQYYEKKNGLNLAREDVYQHIYQFMHRFLSEYNIKFIKWDHNRELVNPGFMSAPAGEQRAVRIRYMENLYRLVDALRKDFPDVWFENCSSGGGRIDMGMARFFDLNWPSDNINPVDRIFIHDSYLTLFPANTMISWVVRENIWLPPPLQQFPLAYIFDVSMAGVLGVGNDLTICTDEEKELIKNKIDLYKEIREVVQKGDVYRILSPYETNRSIIQYVSKDKKKAVLFDYRLAVYPENTTPETRQSPLVKLRGLTPGTKYRIEKMDGVYSGKYLMEVGVLFPLKGAFTSDIYKIESIN